jgi:hypothetical protein
MIMLPAYSRQAFDAVETIDLRDLPVVEISIGRQFHHEQDASEPDYREQVVVEKVLPREGEPKVCVRVSVLSDPTTGRG